jgi:hypothetical protein
LFFFSREERRIHIHAIGPGAPQQAAEADAKRGR